MTTKHSPAFRNALRSAARGDKLIVPVKSYLQDPAFPDFMVKVEGLGKREPDYFFHPSEHPGWPAKALYIWMTAPHLLLDEPQEPTAILSMTAGSIWHSIIGHILHDALGIVTQLEVPVLDERRRTRGKMDGLIDGGVEIYELKGLAVDTVLPTPSGWTTMRDVAVGDMLIGADGSPCSVTEISDVSWKRCYRITFDDATSVIADEDHRWVSLVGQSGRCRPSVVTTAEMKRTISFGRGQANHRIANAGPLNLPDEDLPLDPYILGAWLGDGSKHNGAITQRTESPLWDVVRKSGFEVGEEWGGGQGTSGTRTLYGLRRTLLDMGLLNERKTIPPIYLRGSIAQRTALLQGLMDTDGTWSKKRRQAVFTSVDSSLAHQVRELVLSLGMRCRIQKVNARGFGVSTIAYHVIFTPLFDPFRARAGMCSEAISSPPVRSSRRAVTSVEFIGVLQTKCVMVDSPDHTYLCGEQMVPTHNTMKDRRLSMMTDVQEYLRLNPTYHLQANEYMRMSGLRLERVLLMSLTFPYEMKEFVVEFDHRLASQTEEKYEAVLQAVADGRPPLCDGCYKTNTCPARGVCRSDLGFS